MMGIESKRRRSLDRVLLVHASDWCTRSFLVIIRLNKLFLPIFYSNV